MFLEALAAAAITGAKPSEVKPPAWLRRPTPQEMYTFYPAQALAAKIGGKALINCRVNVQGAAEDCQVVTENPPGQGFGAAAVQTAKLFEFTPATSAGIPFPGRVSIPLAFSLPPAPQPAMPADFIAPVWLKAPTEEAVNAAWPPKARAAHINGKADLDCLVNTNGGAEDCHVLSETPPGQGFGEAAVRLSPTLLFTPASVASGPIQQRIHITLGFPPAQLTGEVTPPAWFKKPSAADLIAAWPSEALSRGIGGKVTLTCMVSLHGELEACHVVSESPEGMGFGAAAMLLTPQFLFKPATRDGQPVISNMTLPLKFENNETPAPDAVGWEKTAVVDQPIWATAPSFADIATAYPKRAGGASGYVSYRCDVRKSGELNHCNITRAEPTGRGFEAATRGLIARFRLDMSPAMLALRGPVQTNVSIRLIDPESADFVGHRIGEPTWIVALDPKRVHKLYPAEAAARGIKTGRGVAICTVAADGGLSDCSPAPATPNGVGFSEAAVQVAQVMKMNRWTQDGGPIDGAKVQLPIRFNLADDAAVAK